MASSAIPASLTERVLLALDNHPEGLTVPQLTELASAPDGRHCFSTISNMMRAGYVQRAEPVQKRKTVYLITEGGRKRIAKGNFKVRGRFRHGTAAAYGHYLCRCAACREWAAQSYKRLRARRPDLTEYGTKQSRKWRAANPEKNAELRAAGHAHTRRLNEELRAAASRHGQVWTGPEMEIASRKDLSVEQAARLLGRSLRAVSSMRTALNAADDPRARMLREGPVPPTSRSRSRPRTPRPDETLAQHAQGSIRA